MEQKDFFIGIFKGDNKYESLALRMSLATLEDYTGQNSIVGDGKLLKRAMENDSLHSVIFYGHSGCGKNALAKIIATKTKEFFEEANAVLNGNHSDVLNHLKDASLDGKKFWHGYTDTSIHIIIQTIVLNRNI